MPRRNARQVARPERVGKGKKRPRDYHRSTHKGIEVVTMPDLPDVGSGADPTAAAAPVPLRRGTHRGEAAT
jgi:hypothetical protein